MVAAVLQVSTISGYALQVSEQEIGGGGPNSNTIFPHFLMGTSSRFEFIWSENNSTGCSSFVLAYAALAVRMQVTVAENSFNPPKSSLQPTESRTTTGSRGIIFLALPKSKTALAYLVNNDGP